MKTNPETTSWQCFSLTGTLDEADEAVSKAKKLAEEELKLAGAVTIEHHTQYSLKHNELVVYSVGKPLAHAPAHVDDPR